MIEHDEPDMPEAAIAEVPILFDDDDLAWYAREHDPAFLESISRARQQVADRRTVSHQDLKRELGLE